MRGTRSHIQHAAPTDAARSPSTRTPARRPPLPPSHAAAPTMPPPLNAAATRRNRPSIVSALHSATLPPGSPLHEQAVQSTVSISPRTAHSSHAALAVASTSSTPARGGTRPMSSTPKGGLGASPVASSVSFTPAGGDPLGLRRRAGTRPHRPSSLGSFMSLPNINNVEGHLLVGDESIVSQAEDVASALGSDHGDELIDHEVDDEFEPINYSMVDRLRVWRDDARSQHLYETAAFWGYKVWGMTADANDAFWLAQIYFLTAQYARAEKVLTGVRRLPPLAYKLTRPVSSGQVEPDVDAGEMSFVDTCLYSTPATRPQPLQQDEDDRMGRVGVRMTDYSTACRYLAAQCMIRQSKWTQALEMLGEVNPFRLSRASRKSKEKEKEGQGQRGDGGIHFEASMCHLRGLVHLHNKANDRAKECFMEALALDIKCYDSFQVLVGGHMLKPEEEWEFVTTLAYKAQIPEDAEFVKAIYMSRLKKYSHLTEILGSLKKLKDEFNMGEDPDAMFGLADYLYGVYRWADCFRITTRILSLHEMHGPTLPLHLTCMHHLSHAQPALFLLAHELIERDPEAPIGWYAAGLWYFGQNRWDECRRFFSKSAMLDTRFAPAWFGFGHSLALEGEHDQAITAYSTAQHYFQGTHLPLMFIGMQHILLANTTLAVEYLDAAFSMCKDDPLLLNERGVLLYYQENYREATFCFDAVIKLAKKVQSVQGAWATTFLNLSHCFRKLKFYDAAVDNARNALELLPRSSAGLTTLGMAYHAKGQLQTAILSYHESLAILPADPNTTELLRHALERSSSFSSVLSPGSSFTFPGLSIAVAKTLDREVDHEDEDIKAYTSTAKSNVVDEGGNVSGGDALMESFMTSDRIDESSAMMED